MLASASDVEVRLGRSLTAAELAQVDGLLDEASLIVESWLRCASFPWTPARPGTPINMTLIPVRVRLVVSRMVARVLLQAASNASTPVGATQVQQTAGPFSQGVSYAAGVTSGAPWLAKIDKDLLRDHRCGGGAVSLGLRSDHLPGCGCGCGGL
jgi:hypothetical protein